MAVTSSKHPQAKGPSAEGLAGSRQRSRLIAIPEVLADMNLPQVREFASHLRFSPIEGSIWLADRRMVLLHAQAFAALREELIASLGTDTARGLLTRIGYAAGCSDAQVAMKIMGHSLSADELRRTGPILHSLQGFAMCEGMHTLDSSDSLQSDFHAEWIWRNSVEDEAHVEKHGIGSHAVCWTEVGHSSGFLSTCIGRRILVREVECRAMGHAACRNVAKPVSSWDDADEDLRFMEPQPAPPRQFVVPRTLQTAPGAMTVASAQGDDLLVGASTAYNVMRHKVHRVAPTQATVLILGESGVGKSVVARSIHRHSLRASEKFIEVNCAAIPETLIEAELFGVERGAYSGAVATRPGRFEAADGGSLFLDEIGTLSMSAQGKLLRVLQNGELERLGSNRTMKTDVRVIAATNEDLKEAVRQGRFREDLFFRLNVFPIVIQPLRSRREDIPLLAERLLERFARRHGRQINGISTHAMQALLDHAWPGNIRELENVLERGVILAEAGEVLDTRHLFSADETITSAPIFRPSDSGALATASAGSPAQPGPPEPDLPASLDAVADALVRSGQCALDEVEATLVRSALRHAKGNISRAAGLLQVTRAQAEYRVKKLGLQ